MTIDPVETMSAIGRKGRIEIEEGATTRQIERTIKGDEYDVIRYVGLMLILEPMWSIRRCYGAGSNPDNGDMTIVLRREVIK